MNAARHEQRVLGQIPNGFWTGILLVLAFGLLDSRPQDGPAFLRTVWLCLQWPTVPCLVF